MAKAQDIGLAEIEELRESLWRAYQVFGSWRVVGRRLLGMSGGYAWKIAQGQLTPKKAVVYHWREFWLGLRDAPWKTTQKIKDAAWGGGKHWDGIKDRWGPENAISVPELAKWLNVSERRARATVRALRKDGYPVCTTLSPGGAYFRPRSLEEYRYWRNKGLWRRAADIIDTVGAQERDELKWYPPEVTESVQLSLSLEGVDVREDSIPTAAPYQGP